MTWLKWSGVALAVLLVVGMGAVAYGSWHWEQGTKAILARLEAARVTASTSTAPTRYDARELEGLPAPVQRYFRAVLKDGQPIIAAATVQHTGTFNMSDTGEQWKPFTSKQRVITQRPGFDWDARIMMFPGIPVHIHDSYIAGQGILRGAVLGLIPVVNMADTPELARGELMRFFAEAAWYPTALLPSQGVRWEALDESSAKATITDDKIALTLTFSFSDEGVINTVHAKSRERVVDGKTVVAPWLGRFWSYALRDGMLVPTHGEVAWLLAQGQKPYWRGTTTSISFEFANPS